MPTNKNGRLGSSQATVGLSIVSISSLSGRTPAAKRFLQALASVCETAATTKDENVAALGLALIAKAPNELSRLLEGRR